MGELGEGKSFGELALLTDKPRNATIFTKSSQVTLGVLTKRDYQRLIGESFLSKMDKSLDLLKSYELFRGIRKAR